MDIQQSLTTITLLGMCLAALMLGGCVTLQRSTTEEPSRRLDGAEAGERVTSAELDQLTRGFADRYVGLLYSVCDALKEDNPDPEQRRAAQILLVDNATNVYDIASNADAFTRVLDLVVVTTLVSQEWDVDGRAVAVFGERGQALADVHSVTDQIEQLPANIAAERQAILTGIDDRLQRADATITKVRKAVDEANTFVTSLKPAVELLNEMFTTADTLYGRFAASTQSRTGNEGYAFDIREYEQTAKEVTIAVEEMNELLTRAELLLGPSDLKHGIQEVNDAVDGRIMTMADQSQVVMNAFFWRACALLGVLFTMLILYRVISLLLMRHLEKGQAAK